MNLWGGGIECWGSSASSLGGLDRLTLLPVPGAMPRARGAGLGGRRRTCGGNVASGMFWDKSLDCEARSHSGELWGAFE